MKHVAWKTRAKKLKSQMESFNSFYFFFFSFHFYVENEEKKVSF